LKDETEGKQEKDQTSDESDTAKQFHGYLPYKMISNNNPIMRGTRRARCREA
jgi:hypothetical protein